MTTRYGHDAIGPYPPGSIEFEATLGEETARRLANRLAREPGSTIKPWSDMSQDERSESVQAVLIVRYALAEAWPHVVARTRHTRG
ncbi:hypothetical protein [Frondihabitans australicus]|uniref:Uncharacterized protein n=1 Tax=Frondihabitans australicus TaxID=386892 RepID=A0A495IFG5_9MICO|nr:hypothetical protein [Frondihabitans australicus]RKR74747.1 hypothetical protein C8E83_1876 [Frondihabitans australicus]